MRAWRAHEHGPASDVLELEEVTTPSPPAGHVRLRVDACALNFADDLLCRGTYQQRPGLPVTPGMEVVGVVDEVGAGVEVPLGSRHLCAPALPHGGLAEACLARAEEILPLPDVVDDVTGAALYVTYQTAWIGLHHRARLRSGETVLVHAGAGGVGSAAIQVALAAGARVLATAGGPDKVARCRQLGADVAIDHRADDVVEAVRSSTDGRGVDVVVDSVGGPVFESSRRCVGFEGRILVVGFASGEVPRPPLNHVLVKNYDLVGLQWPAYREQRPELVRAAHEALLDLLAAGTIDPLVSDVVDLDGARDGLTALVRGATVGKIVVVPAGPR